MRLVLSLVLGAAAVAGVAGGVTIMLTSGSERTAMARALTGGDPTRGPVLARRYGCAGCHAIPGVPGADGQVGPSLAGLRARVYIGGVLPNTAPNLVSWLQDPRAYAPRTAMPAPGIDAAEARDLAAFLYAQ